MPRTRRSPHALVSTAVAILASVALASACVVACSSSDPQPAPGTVADAAPDVPEHEEPVFDSDDPAGRVLLLRLYEPAKRCFGLPTQIGRFDSTEDGKIAPCGAKAVCYVRADGVLAYHDEDCVHAPNFLANWTPEDYSDLGPCEPIKRMRDTPHVKDCPNASCTWARDVLIDTAASCATAIETKGCRETFGEPTSCFCDGDRVFVPADPKGSTAPPSGFTACDDTNAACKAALAMVDTVKGCAAATSDAGTD